MNKKHIFAWLFIIIAIGIGITLSTITMNASTYNKFDLKNGILQKDAIFDGKAEKYELTLEKPISSEAIYFVQPNQKVDEILDYRVEDIAENDVTDDFKAEPKHKSYMNLSPTKKAVDEEKLIPQKYTVYLKVKYKKGTRIGD